MTKQPKFFYSREKQVKPGKAFVSAAVFAPATLQNSKASIVLSYLSSHVQHIMLGGAVLTLVGLSTLAVLPRVMVMGGFGQRPPIFPQSKFNTALITQSTAGNAQGLTYDVTLADARVDIVKNFLERYKSPLTPAEQYAKMLVEASDRYGLDYRLLPAIMMQESNLCKMSKPELKNCFGFGIHKGGELGFDSYEASFDRVARELKERYIDIGLVTPEQIMTKYTPSSNGSWANSVNQWIAEMEHNDRSKGLANEADANLLEYAGKK